MQGKIKFWSEKGFGFIETPELNDDVFVHFSDIISGGNEYKSLKQGTVVDFEIENQDNGKTKAIKVTVL